MAVSISKSRNYKSFHAVNRSRTEYCLTSFILYFVFLLYIRSFICVFWCPFFTFFIFFAHERDVKEVRLRVATENEG